MAGTLFCTTATSSFAEDIGNYELQGPPEYKTNPIEALAEEDLSNKVVILSTNDIHGAILQYAYFAALKNYFEEKASGVLLVDSGDFSSDKSKKDNKDIADYKLCGYLSDADHPERSIELMNAAGYDYACLGNHEFDYGSKTLKNMLSSAKFTVLDANINTGETGKDFKYYPHAVTDFKKSPLKIGFFGLDTSEIQRALGDWNKGYTVDDKEELNACAKEQVNALINPTDKNAVPADLVICLSHLGMQKEYAPNSKDQREVGTTGAGKIGTRSIDLYHNVPGIDLILDAHSHTAIFAGKKDEPIMSGQIWGNYLGITIIDNSTKAIDRYLISDRDYESIFGTTAEERVSKLNKNGAGPVIELLKKYTGKSETELFDYDYKDDESSKSDNPGKSGRGNDGKYTGRNSGKNNGKNNNSRFGKRGFEYDEEDTEYEETAEPVEDASVVASTSDESTEFTSEASSDNSSELNEQSTEAASTEETAETSEQDNTEQSEDTEVEPAA